MNCLNNKVIEKQEFSPTLASFCFLFLFVSLFFVTSCSSGEYEGQRFAPVGGNTPPPDEEAEAGKMRLAIVTSDQAKATFEQLTGVRMEPRTTQDGVIAPAIFADITDNNLRTQVRRNFLLSETSSPFASPAEGLAPSHIGALSSLAATYCAVIAAVDVRRAQFFSGTPFAASGTNFPRVQIFSSVSNRQILADHLVSRFWVDAQLDPQRFVTQKDQLANLIETLRLGEPDTNLTVGQRSTINVMIGACTAALAARLLH